MPNTTSVKPVPVATEIPKPVHVATEIPNLLCMFATEIPNLLCLFATEIPKPVPVATFRIDFGARSEPQGAKGGPPEPILGSILVLLTQFRARYSILDSLWGPSTAFWNRFWVPIGAAGSQRRITRAESTHFWIQKKRENPSLKPAVWREASCKSRVSRGI